ncbi:bifunctional hydroxymethylpyrimidine kinase/phosphomethylpyrimidine kinase [Bacillus sp. REN3]|uniref:bifunctional hydroxymethylpyrimidine kinase/phosphomethylpyrimidine kinase n=1 Tax=Bacillus sp. REN3 TaxID=2802440 RepID=UPI001AED5276|nr:bifunctional hydroxymethylpyrimidine kinase/phosphomethylpyrimidine kinase [Bacillus sp. REN3]
MKKALTIAGSDSGGGAGIQADLKTFQELEVFGMSALTAVTAQNTVGVQGVFPLEAEAVARQIQSVGEDIGVDALKTGMLFNAGIIEAVAGKIKQFGWENVVIDPVMIAKGGSALLQNEAVAALKKFMVPLCNVITPNIPEAEVLTGMSINNPTGKKEAAKRLYDQGARNVVIKGGHEDDLRQSVDLLFDGRDFFFFESERVKTKNTHGTGCTFSAAITAQLAKGYSVYDAVSVAKDFIQAAIAHPIEIGNGHGPTNHWAYMRGVGAERGSLQWKE